MTIWCRFKTVAVKCQRAAAARGTWCVPTTWRWSQFERGSYRNDIRKANLLRHRPIDGLLRFLWVLPTVLNSHPIMHYRIWPKANPPSFLYSVSSAELSYVVPTVLRICPCCVSYITVCTRLLVVDETPDLSCTIAWISCVDCIPIFVLILLKFYKPWSFLMSS